MAQKLDFLGLEDCYAVLSVFGDSLKKLGEIINVEAFHYRVEKALEA